MFVFLNKKKIFRRTTKTKCRRTRTNQRTRTSRATRCRSVVATASASSSSRVRTARIAASPSRSTRSTCTRPSTTRRCVAWRHVTRPPWRGCESCSDRSNDAWRCATRRAERCRLAQYSVQYASSTIARSRPYTSCPSRTGK